MKAIVLAAGMGTRLRPHTEALPKAMMPVGGRPLLEHTLGWLRRQGVGDIAINLHHLPDIVRGYFEDGRRYGVHLTYSYEPEILGTAGAVRKLRGFPERTFLVVYGDMLVDVALDPLLRLHRERDVAVTVALMEPEDPRGCGMVLRDENQRITRFVEKPQDGEASGGIANAGIYVMEPWAVDLIPEDTFYDFGTHFFPDLLARGVPMYGQEVQGTLIDIGTPQGYAQAQLAAFPLSVPPQRAESRARSKTWEPWELNGESQARLQAESLNGHLGDHLDRSLASAMEAIDGIRRPDIEEVVAILLKAHAEGRSVYIFGNGGSASTATHFACDLSKATICDGVQRMRVLSLTDNVALLTAWANDTSYENVFAEQLRNLLNPGDVVVAISASGNSPNILAGLRVARAVGAMTVGLTGFGGGKLEDLVDACVVVPSYEYGPVESAHMVLEHVITDTLKALIAQGPRWEDGPGASAPGDQLALGGRKSK